MTWVKRYNEISGHLSHDKRRCLLGITILKKGKIICKTVMTNINSIYARYFVKNLTEQDLKEIINTNMEVL